MQHGRILAILSTALLAAWLSGCAGNTTGGMEVPVVPPPPKAPQGTASLFEAHGSSQASFRLEKVLVDLPRGTPIAHFPNRFWRKWEYIQLCNLDYGPNATIEWGAGTGYFGDWSTEAGRIFFDAMKRRGANVVGDSSALFEAERAVGSAEFLVGARITDIRGNICEPHEPLTSIRTNQYLGEFYVKVEWEVFSSLARRVVYKFQTQGYAETKNSKRNGVTVTLLDAFAAAVEYASVDAGFRKVLARDRGMQLAERAPAEHLAITGARLDHEPLRQNLAEATVATVTLEPGTGHGSGFLVSREGYLLTNAHVVGDAKKVPVVFRNGVRVSGTVLRASKRRDVALVRIPIVVSHILPVRRSQPIAVGEDVYVIGTPFDRELRSTVTKGIVSAFRKFDGIDFIQSDAAVTGGNSGGPLLDANGNVVGITVAKFTQGENLNLFIPIDDALAALNVAISVE